MNPFTVPTFNFQPIQNDTYVSELFERRRKGDTKKDRRSVRISIPIIPNRNHFQLPLIEMIRLESGVSRIVTVSFLTKNHINTTSYGALSYPFVCHYVSTNNESRRFSSVFRMHMKIFPRGHRNKNKITPNEEFLVFETGSFSFFDNFETKIRFEYERRFPSEHMEKVKLYDEEGKEIDFQRYDLLLITKILSLKKNCESSFRVEIETHKTGEKGLFVRNMRNSSRFRSLGLVYEAFECLKKYHPQDNNKNNNKKKNKKKPRDFRVDLKFLSILSVYDPKQFLESAQNVLVKMERQIFQKNNIPQEAYRVVLPKDQLSKLSPPKKIRRGKKKKHLRKNQSFMRQKQQQHSKNKKNSKIEFPKLDLSNLKTRVHPLKYEYDMLRIIGNLNEKEQVGHLCPHSYITFIRNIICQSLSEEDYETAFRISSRSLPILWTIPRLGGALDRLGRATFFSSFKIYQIKVASEEKRMNREPKVSMQMNLLYEDIVTSIGQCGSCSEIGTNEKKDIFDCKISKIDLENERSKDRVHYQKLLDMGDFLLYRKPKYNNNILKGRSQDPNLYSLDIPFLIELAFLKRYGFIGQQEEEKKEIVFFDEGMKILHHLIFKSVVCASLEISSFSQVEHDYLFHRPFVRILQRRSDPFLIGEESFEKRRVYHIIHTHFLKHFKKVKLFLEEEEEDQEHKISYEMNVYGRLLFSLGHFDLSVRYFRESCKSSSSTSNIPLFSTYYELGEYEKCENQAIWIFSILDKNRNNNNSKEDGNQQILEIDKILNILKKKEGKNVGNNNNIRLFRSPIPISQTMKDDIWCILGWKDDDGKRSDSFLYEVISEEQKEDKIRMLKSIIGNQMRYNVSEFYHPMRFKHINNHNISNIQNIFKLVKEEMLHLRICYKLAISSFLQGQFPKFEEWIHLLSSKEFNAFFYSEKMFRRRSPNIHHLYQIAASSYFHNFYQSKEEEKVEVEERKIYVIGNEQIFPFSNLSIGPVHIIEKTRRKRVSFKMIPIWISEEDSIDLFNLRKEETLAWKLIQRRIENVVNINVKKKKIDIIFMGFGHTDLRRRILNLPCSDPLHHYFSEDVQIKLLSDIFIRFIDDFKRNNRNMIRRIGVCPAFPFLDVLEQVRLLEEKSINGSGYCENRLRLFNKYLQSGINKKKIKFLGCLNEYISENGGAENFDLGCGGGYVKVDSGMKKVFASWLSQEFCV